MLCSFKKMKTEWICENCGRRLSFTAVGEDRPISAKCRIPNNFIKIENRSIINELFDKEIDGVGSKLSEILSKIGIKYQTNCECSSKIKLLNKKGIIWCKNNMSTILEWMNDEAKKKNIPFIESAAKAILRLAIIKTNKYHTDNIPGLNQ